MIHDKGRFKRFTPVGPGGKKCGCCFPQTGSARSALFRFIKRTERMLARREIERELLQLRE